MKWKYYSTVIGGEFRIFYMLRGGHSPGYWNASLRGKRSENSSSHRNSNPVTLDCKEWHKPMRLGEHPPPQGSGSVTDRFCLPRGARRLCLRGHSRTSVRVRACEDAEGRRVAAGPDPHFTFFTCPSAVCFLLESWGSPLASHLRNVTSHLFLVWYGGSLRSAGPTQTDRQTSLPHPSTGSVCGVTGTVLLRADVLGGYGLG